MPHRLQNELDKHWLEPALHVRHGRRPRLEQVERDGRQAVWKDLAAMLVAMASQHVPNTAHAVGTNHTPILYGQTAMPEFQEKGWALIAGTPMLKYAEFMPNHAKIGQFNAITYTGVQAVETGEMSPEDAAEMVVEELETELGDDVIILD